MFSLKNSPFSHLCGCACIQHLCWSVLTEYTGSILALHEGSGIHHPHLMFNQCGNTLTSLFQGFPIMYPGWPRGAKKGQKCAMGNKHNFPLFIFKFVNWQAWKVFCVLPFQYLLFIPLFFFHYYACVNWINCCVLVLKSHMLLLKIRKWRKGIIYYKVIQLNICSK